MKDVISVSSSLSVTVTETELSPKKSVLGVIIRLLPSVEISVVKFSTLATLKVFVSPSSTSVADSGMVIEPSSSTVWGAITVITGASDTGWTKTLKVRVWLAPTASVATTLILPEPFQSWAGVIETILLSIPKVKLVSDVKDV